MNILKKLFTIEKKEEPIPCIGDYLIAKIIISRAITQFASHEYKSLKGVIAGVYEGNIKIGDEWYKVGYEVGDIVINSIIKENILQKIA